MTDPFRTDYLTDATIQFQKLKALAEKALAQVSDAEFLAQIDAESNSLALLVKHLAGNMRSRWTDFLTTDGEKPDRERDREFEPEPGDSRTTLMRAWEDGWGRLFESVRALGPADLDRTVRIRREPHSVLQAIDRQMTHAAYHVGQIVFLAKHLRSRDWQTLSIPRGQSAEFNERMRPAARPGP